MAGREDVLRTWSGVAAAWERHADTIRRTSAPVTEWLVGRLDPQPGQTILELAAGAGDTGFLVAERLDRDGNLISSDFAPEMVEVARRRAAKLGIGTIEFGVLDAQAIDLPDNHVDGIVCRFGFMLMPEPDAALEKCRRVLRDGGTLVLATWGAPERNPWIMALGMAMIQHGHPPPGDPFEPGGIFSLSDPKRVIAMLKEAGFEGMHAEELALTHRFDAFDDYWGFQSEVAGPLAEMIAALPESERANIRETVRETLAAFSDDEGLALPAAAVVAATH